MDEERTIHDGEMEVVVIDTPEEMEQIGLDAVAVESNVRFCITNDSCADWAVRKINEEKAEFDRLKELATQQIAEITEKVEAARKRFENGTSYLAGCLHDYFQTVPHKTTKTTEKYRLLSGTLTLKKGGIKTTINDKALVTWLRANGLDDFVKVTEAAVWGDLKKRLTFTDGVAIVEDTGEIVEGVTVEKAPDTFHVEK